jgi:hypothetical protein
VVESNRLLIYRTSICTQGSNPCFSFLEGTQKKKKLTEEAYKGRIWLLIWDCSSIG